MFATSKSGKIKPLSLAKFHGSHRCLRFPVLFDSARLHDQPPRPTTPPTPFSSNAPKKPFPPPKPASPPPPTIPTRSGSSPVRRLIWRTSRPLTSARKDIAEQGIAAARQLLAANTNSVEGHYYLGMNLGELAETETLGALKLVREMETEFILVLHTNAAFDNAGPDRNLGLLYRDCPGWPASIGNRGQGPPTSAASRHPRHPAFPRTSSI